MSHPVPPQPPDPAYWARHSRMSDPGPGAARLADVPGDPGDPGSHSAVVRNVVVHYRFGGADLPSSSDDDVDARWLRRILALDESRHPDSLDTPRPVASRVQGCCRDFTLLSVGALREHGVPARSVVGFASYFTAGWHYDHVVPELWDGSRWRRFEPEVAAPTELLPAPLDLPRGPGAPVPAAAFETAAEVWTRYRHEGLDLSSYGVDTSLPELGGPWFVRNYVIHQVAHRYGDELLLWDGWGAMGGPGSEADDLDLVDEVAGLLTAADAGEAEAEVALHARYRADARLHPGSAVLRQSPRGGEPELEVLPGYADQA